MKIIVEVRTQDKSIKNSFSMIVSLNDLREIKEKFGIDPANELSEVTAEQLKIEMKYFIKKLLEKKIRK